MKIIIFISAVCLQLQWSYGKPEGVGAFAYQDTAGNRYGGTYGLKDDGQAYNFKNTDEDSTFQPNQLTGFPDLDTFFPEYFMNLENLIQDLGGRRYSFTQTFTRRSGGPSGFNPARNFGFGFKPIMTRRAFRKNADQQQKALNAARRAFDLTSNHIGYVPNFDTEFNRFPGFPSFGLPSPGMNMPGFGGLGSPFMQPYGDSAFAGGVVAPGYRHQMVALNPTNPNMPNIDVTQFSDDNAKGGPGFYSVQSSSFVSSANINGQQTSHKGGETIVNDNGKITKYSLHN